MADENKFLIDGVEYPIPGLETFNMADAFLLYEYSGLSLEDFAIDEEDPEQVEELGRKTKNPGFIFTLMLVAFLRGNKGTPKNKAVALIETSNLVSAYEAFLDAGMEEDPTPTQESEITAESSSGNGSDSGESSQMSLIEPDTSPVLTGTIE